MSVTEKYFLSLDNSHFLCYNEVSSKNKEDPLCIPP